MNVKTIIAPKHHAKGRNEAGDVVVSNLLIHTQHEPSSMEAGLP